MKEVAEKLNAVALWI